MSKAKSQSQADHLLEACVGRKPTVLINKWKEQFFLSGIGAKKCTDRANIDPNLQIDIKEEKRLENGWQLIDGLGHRRYFIAKQTTTKTIAQTCSFVAATISTLASAVSLALPDEGPLGEQGVSSFNSYAFWPYSRNELRQCTLQAQNGNRSEMLQMSVDSIETHDDENIITSIAAMLVAGTQDDSTKEGLVLQVLHHVQQLNWPPDGYPPTCTYSVLRIVEFLRKCSNDSSDVLVTCSDGKERSAAFVVLCCCAFRLTKLPDASKTSIADIVFEMVRAVRVKRPLTIRHFGTFLWLSYAVIEFAYSITRLKRKEKEDKHVYDWLLKLRKVVYDIATTEDTAKK